MDRPKKSKMQHSSDLFALGGGNKNPAGKRDGTSQLPSTSKKARITPSTISSSGAPSSSSENWEDAINTECENIDLISSVLQATDQQDSDKIVSLVCSALKSLSNPKSKNDSVLITSLLYLAKIRPHIFANDNIVAAILSLLKTDSSHSVRHAMKSNTTVFAMAANLLARGHFDKKKWPETFVKTYIDDAVNERLWVDCEECSFFTDHISKSLLIYLKKI
jgi:integrator complex subunit 1